MARTGRPTPTVTLTDEERETLERWARRPSSAQALAMRCRIVLVAADPGAVADARGSRSGGPMTTSANETTTGRPTSTTAGWGCGSHRLDCGTRVGS